VVAEGETPVKLGPLHIPAQSRFSVVQLQLLDSKEIMRFVPFDMARNFA